jgi:mxaL protein
VTFQKYLGRLDGNGWLLIMAAIILLGCLLKPHMQLPKPVYHWMIVLDITQSMNVRDYKVDANSVSRLVYAKQGIRAALRRLPCGSKVALGLFTERNAINIVRPLEVCSHFGALDETVAGLDWRMAWAADSFISHGLFDAIAQTKKIDPNMRLLFITDGQQAPPGNPDYMPSFEGKRGAVSGVVLGAGNVDKSPIPKLDEQDNIIGYWELEDVQRYATFGMAHVQSALEMEHQQIENQHGRNAPFGTNPEAIANANLSGLDEVNLQNLAKSTGLEYQALTTAHDISDTMNAKNMLIWQKADTDLRPLLGFFAVLMLTLYFVPNTYKHPSIYKQRFFQYFKFRRNK